MEGYLGQVCRSRSWVKCQGHEVKNVYWEVSLTSESIVMMDLPKKKTREYDVGCFQSMCSFIISVFADIP